jgi:DNA-binding NarL/FixJ family response regulator
MRPPQPERSEPDEVSAQVSRLDGTALSPREKQVALLLLRGLTLRQIAPELKLTPATVATYSKSIYRKLGINSRAELFLRFGAGPGRKDGQ